MSLYSLWNSPKHLGTHFRNIFRQVVYGPIRPFSVYSTATTHLILGTNRNSFSSIMVTHAYVNILRFSLARIAVRSSSFFVVKYPTKSWYSTVLSTGWYWYCLSGFVVGLVTHASSLIASSSASLSLRHFLSPLKRSQVSSISFSLFLSLTYFLFFRLCSLVET